MRKRFLISSLLVSSLFSTNAMAEVEFQGLSLGGQAGIFGLGANLKGKFTDTLGIKVGFDKFSYRDYEITDDKVKYNFDVETQDMLATVDWHPYAGSFKASVGVIINSSNLNGTITPNIQAQSFTFNDITYSTEDIAKVITKADFDPVAPYVGIGWDTSWNKKSGWGFTFDIGVIHQGSASIDYTVAYKEVPQTGNAAVDAAANAARETLKSEIDANLAAEKKSLQTQLDKYEYLPYITIGVNYKF